MLDPKVTFSQHINLVARKCYYQLRQLRVVSRSLTHQSTLALVHVFTHVSSRIDFCRSLLVGLLLGILARLDLVLSFLLSITAYMCDIVHWLPISGYNIALLPWSPGMSFAAGTPPPLIFVTSAAQCRFWKRVACCVLLRGVSFWCLGPIYIYCAGKGLFSME